ncbi:MAG: PAS domain S-box protein [Actinomycetia bacterium]|nr:PAS domain S-box protein [Actinomycetes bacterium]
MVGNAHPGFVFGLDADGEFVWLAPEVVDVLGWLPQDLVGTAITDLVHVDDRTDSLGQLSRMADKDGLAGVDDAVVIRFRDSDGAYRWLSWGEARRSDSVGRANARVASLRDVDALTRLHNEVQSERNRLRATLDALTDPQVMFESVRDESGAVVGFRCVEANEAAVASTGGSYPGLVGAQVTEMFPQDVASDLLETFRGVVDTGDALVEEDQHYAVGGQDRFWDSCAARVGDGVSLVWRDVTKRHVAAEALVRAREQYRMVAENAADVVLLISPQWTVTWVSPAIRQVLGFEPTSLLGTNTGDWVHPDDMSVVASIREAQVDEQVGAPFQIRVRDASGEYRWMSGISRATSDVDGNVNGRITTLRDVNEQVLAQERLERSEAHFRLLAENASDVVAQVGQDQSIVWVSPSVEPVLGWRPDEVIGQDIVGLTHPDDRPAGRQWREQSRDESESPHVELRVLTGTGGYRWMSLTARQAPAPDGAPVGRVISLRDVQEQMQSRRALANSQRRYKMLAENASDVVCEVDADAMITWMTPSVQLVLGWTKEDLIGEPVASLVDPQDLNAAGEGTRQALVAASLAPQELRFRTAEEQLRWMSLRAQIVCGETGEFEGAILALRDVHEQVLARQQLTRSEEMFRLAMQNSAHGMAVVDLDGKILRANETLCAMLGRDLIWLREHPEQDVLHPEDRARCQAARDNLLGISKESEVHEGRVVTAAGETVWVQHSLSLVRDEGGAPAFYVSQYQDITASRARVGELQYRAEHDPLTGLLNRTQLHETLVDALAREPRAGGSPGVLFGDLDGFKDINDTHGHAGGDRVLRVIAKRIGTVLRAADEVAQIGGNGLARLGGDEFVVVLPKVADVPTAVAVAERIRRSVAQPISLDEEEVALTMSIGVALATGDPTGDELLHNADLALYQAKDNGRNQVAVFEANGSSSQ